MSDYGLFNIRADKLLFQIRNSNLRKASMSVALPVTSCLHLGQMQGLKLFLVVKINVSKMFFYIENIYSLARFT